MGQNTNSGNRYLLAIYLLAIIGRWQQLPLVIVAIGVVSFSSVGLQGQDFGAANVPANAGSARMSPSGLPSTQGQVWREYDLRNYTTMMRDREKPHQGAIKALSMAR